MPTNHKVIIGDARDMREVPDQSVHLVVTSPPYWQLKDYGAAGQIGFDDTYETYINNLNLVWHECHRVLHPGCRLCINIGDQFARSVYYGRYKIIPIRTEIIKFCESDGFDYMGAVIWRKVTTCNTTGGAVVMGSFPYPRNGILKLNYEFILIFKKYGEAPKASKAVKEASKMTTEEWNEYFSGHWTFPGEKQKKHLAMFPEELPRRLIRMFSFVGDTVLDPFLGSGTTLLAARNLDRHSIGYEINPDFVKIICEKLACRGAVAAPEGNRTHPPSGPGKEPGLFDEEETNHRAGKPGPYTDERTGRRGASATGGLARSEIEFITQDDSVVDFAAAIQRLPYIFHDPIAIDKKMDPRKRHFGSRIAFEEDASASESGIGKGPKGGGRA
jgi:modification methylase